MPLHGKIVVIKRSGGDGTEFPLTASCLFGRKPDCDIRIQLPQVSKEHCRIDLNENKEVILTNLSSANPTRVNGELLQQSERLKHGDVITIIDRSFRFEYPPAPTPKKRSAVGGKTETLKVLQDQQVGDAAIDEKGEKRFSEVSTDPCLKDGANHDNIQRSLEKTWDVESKADDSLLQNKTDSPFSDLYQMIKKSLDVKTPRKSAASLLETPSSRFCSPKPGSVRKNGTAFSENKSTPEKETRVLAGAVSVVSGTPESMKKQRPSLQVPSTEMAGPRAEKAESGAKLETTSPRRRNSTTPQKFTVSEVIEQITAQTPKSPKKRRSKEVTPGKNAVTKDQEEKTVTPPKSGHLQKASPRNSGKAEKVTEVSKKRKSGELGEDVPTSQMKRKRVSFGSYLSPELFDKRLPPDSPLRKGATPRRSLSLYRPKQSLLRRASVIGLLEELNQGNPNVKSPAKKRTPSPKKSPSTKSASPKTPASAKKSPKSRSPSPKAASPAKKSSKSRSPSPKTASPAKKLPKYSSASPKAAAPAKKSPKSESLSPARGRSPSKNKVETLKTNQQLKNQRRASTPGLVSHKQTPIGKRRASLGVLGSDACESGLAVFVTPAKTPVSSGVQTPMVKGRFSVSRISTPSPTAEANIVADQVRFPAATPKTHMGRKSTSRKTPGTAKSAVKVMQRRSGISRASMKVSNPWAHIVKFGQPKAQVVVPTKKTVPQKSKKKAVPKPQTPARNLKGHVSTGHADSPATIVVGRAYRQTIVQPTGAAPRVITNIALFKKNMKLDDDLTGVSEMFKTPVNERKRRSLASENSVLKTPAGGQGTSVIEPSVLNTPEEPGEMVVSPLSVASAVKGRRYNSEAVQRLLDEDQESSFVSDIPAHEINSESEKQNRDLPTASVKTLQQKPELPECLTGVKRIMKTPRQKAQPVEDLRGKLLKTPKQKPEQEECLTAVKRTMKTPRLKAEPVEDLRGKILKTPKQRVEQQECLTGVKRIMKTPKQKGKPLEDIRGKLLKTPKQKPEEQECLTGVRRIFRTPKQKAEPLEDLRGKLLKTPRAPEGGDVSLDGVKELLQTPAQMQESEPADIKTPNTKSSPVVHLTGIKRIMKTPKEKSAPVEDMVGVKRLLRTPREKSEPVERNFGIKRLMKSPRLRGNAAVEDFEGIQKLMVEPLTEPVQVETKEDEEQMAVICGGDVAKETGDADHLEVPAGHDKASDAMETISQAAADEKILLEQPRVETAIGKVTKMDPGHEKKSIGGRRAKMVESKAAQDKPEAPDASDDPAIPAPARGRRGKKTEATAPSAVRQTSRGRNAKAPDSTDSELTEESHPQPLKVALKPKRGRNAQKSSDDQAEAVAEPESDQSHPAGVEQKANKSAAPEEKAVLKPKRGRKAKQSEQSVPQQQEVTKDVPQANPAKVANEASSIELEVLPGGVDENESSDVTETVLQTPQTESLPDVRPAPLAQKKAVRGRRAKQVEPQESEEKQEPAEIPEDPIAPTPVRGRRGKKIEVTAQPAVKQLTRGRNAKSQGSPSDQSAIETQVVTETSTEVVSAQTSLINASQEKDSAPQTEEAIVKPLRGRRTKQTPVEPPQPEPEKAEAVSGEHVEIAEPQQPILPTAGKPRRGRKAKQDTVEQEDTVDRVAIEMRQQSQPPARVKRARNAKQEEEKVDDNGKVTTCQEPAKKMRKTREDEQDRAEKSEEAQTVEMVVSEKAEAPLAEQATVAAKPRRGGRKAKQSTECVESTEVQEVPVVSSTDKPKRGRKGKQATEDAEATAENVEHALEAEEKENAEPLAPAVKSSKGRGMRASVKCEVSQTAPAKRARRGTLVSQEETSAESTVLDSEPSSASVEPARKGRRAVIKPTADEATVTIDQTNLEAVEDDAKMPKRSVKWKPDLEIFEIPKATPVKAVRGRKSKVLEQVIDESKNVFKDATKTEEEDLSDKPADSQPVKRARRGAKAADKVEPTVEANVEAETQPKTRRGRSAKK